VTGYTSSTNFPTSSGAFQTKLNNQDAFVTKLNPAGSALGYSTYLGGSGADDGSGVAVDSSGIIYLTGSTSSSDFPTTQGAFSTTFGGNQDAFVTKLDPSVILPTPTPTVTPTFTPSPTPTCVPTSTPAPTTPTPVSTAVVEVFLPSVFNVSRSDCR
jgi:hypothetical protein